MSYAGRAGKSTSIASILVGFCGDRKWYPNRYPGLFGRKKCTLPHQTPTPRLLLVLTGNNGELLQRIRTTVLQGRGTQVQRLPTKESTRVPREILDDGGEHKPVQAPQIRPGNHQSCRSEEAREVDHRTSHRAKMVYPAGTKAEAHLRHNWRSIGGVSGKCSKKNPA